jgi:hypothetical protein
MHFLQISPNFVDGDSNQRTNFCTLRFFLQPPPDPHPPPPTNRRRYFPFHFRPVLSRILPSLKICEFAKGHYPPTPISWQTLICFRVSQQNRCTYAIVLHTQAIHHRHKLIYTRVLNFSLRCGSGIRSPDVETLI